MMSLNSQNSQKLPQAESIAKLLTVLLFIVLCVQLTQLFIQHFMQSKISLPTQNQMARVEPLQSGLMRTLFGGSTQAAQGGNVQLKGVVAVDNGTNQGVAILSIDGKPAEAVQVGHEIAPQVRLVTVLPKSVTIERNGVRESIPLPEPTPASATNSNSGNNIDKQNSAPVPAPTIAPAQIPLPSVGTVNTSSAAVVIAPQPISSSQTPNVIGEPPTRGMIPLDANGQKIIKPTR